MASCDVIENKELKATSFDDDSGWGSLSLFLVEEVMLYLDVPDILESARVCSHWYSVLGDKTFWKKVLKVHRKLCVDNLELLEPDLFYKRLYKMEHALKRIPILLNTGLGSDKTTAMKLMDDINTFLIGSDIRYIPDEIKGNIAACLITGSDKHWDLDLVKSLDWLSVVNLMNHHPHGDTSHLLYRYIYYTFTITEYLKLDWTILTDKAILYVFQYFYVNKGFTVETAMSWSLANHSTCDDATLERLISMICFECFNDVYNSSILIPTIIHILQLPYNAELECLHSGECSIATWFYSEIVPVNEKLYKLEPFEDDNVILTDNNGVLELTWKAGWGIIFIDDKPYEPFFPVFTRAVDEVTLKRFLASLNDGDEISIIIINN